MAEIALTEDQKNVVRRYVDTCRRWRPGIRGFADLEEHMEKRHQMLVDGIAVDNRPGRPVIAADAKDKAFHAAIFGDDDSAMPDMTAEELEQVRCYIIHGEGLPPVRKWRERRAAVNTARVGTAHPPAPWTRMGDVWPKTRAAGHAAAAEDELPPDLPPAA